jgi:hypothetical protein
MSETVKALVVCTIFRLLVSLLRYCGLTRFAARHCLNVPLGDEAQSPPSTELVVLSLLLAINTAISDLILKSVPTRIGANLWRSDVSSLRAILAAMPQTGPFAHLPAAPVDYVDVSCPAAESVWFHRPTAGHSPAAAVMYIHGGGARHCCARAQISQTHPQAPPSHSPAIAVFARHVGALLSKGLSSFASRPPTRSLFTHPLYLQLAATQAATRAVTFSCH